MRQRKQTKQKDIGEEEGIYLLFGATGGCGYHIAHHLLNADKQVRIVTRSFERAKKVFGEDYMKFEGIVKCDYVKEWKYRNHPKRRKILPIAFQPSMHDGTVVTHVINAAGVTHKPEDISELCDYEAVKEIVNLSKKWNVQRYVMISAGYVERPYSFIAFLLNNIAKNVIAHKCSAENYLRDSDINYIIIRPLRLIGGRKDYRTSAVCIGQGDKLTGKVSRSCVGKIVQAVLADKNVPSRVTFECINSKERENERFEWKDIKLYPDSSKLLPNDHLKAKKNIWITFISMFILVFIILLFVWIS